MIERPQHPYTQALVDAVPVPAAGGGGRRELLERRAPRRHRRAQRLPLPPALPAALRALRPGRPAAAPGRRARTSSRPACCTIPSCGHGRGGRGAQRWLSAGAISPARSAVLEPGDAQRDHRRPRRPRRPLAGGRAASAPGVTVVAPPSLPALGRHGDRQRHRASSPPSSRSTSAERWRRRSTSAGRTRSAPSTRPPCSPPGAARTTSSCRSSASATTATWPIRARSSAADVERALEALGDEVAEGSVGAGHRDDLLRLPRRHRNRLAIGRRALTSACCCCATSAIASTSTCSARGSTRSRARGPDAAPASPSARPTPRSRPQQLRRLALRPLLGLARAGSYGVEGSGEIARRLHDREPSAGRSRTTRLNPYFAAAYEAAHEAVYNCLVAARPAQRLDGTMQDAVPDRGRARGCAGDAMSDARLARRGRRAGPGADPPRHLEPARQRDPGRRAARRVPRAPPGSSAELVGPDPGRLNLVARIAGAGEGPSLMLIAPHRRRPGAGRRLDASMPFEGVVRDGRLIGRGAADMKNELAARAVALRRAGAKRRAPGRRRRPGRRGRRGAQHRRRRHVVAGARAPRPALRLRAQRGRRVAARARRRAPGGHRLGRREAGDARCACASSARAGHASVPERRRQPAAPSRRPRSSGCSTRRPAPARMAPSVDARAARRSGAETRRRRRRSRWAGALHPVLADLLPAMTRMTVTPTGRAELRARQRDPAVRRRDLRLPGAARPERGGRPRRTSRRRSATSSPTSSSCSSRSRAAPSRPIDTPLYRVLEDYVAERVPGRRAAAADLDRVHRLALGADRVRHRRLRLRAGAPRRPDAYLSAAHADDESLELVDLAEMAEFHLHALTALPAAPPRRSGAQL